MKKFFFPTVCFLLLSMCVHAQADTSITNAEKRKLVETAEKQFVSKFYAAALENINKAMALNNAPDDGLLYFKIRVLENIYSKSNELTTELETVLQTFFRQVNQFNFPEDKYSEAARINSMLKQFKQKDMAFADSVKNNMDVKNAGASAAIQQRIGNYLKDNPNSYNRAYLTGVADQITAMQRQEENRRIKIATDSTNRAALKKAGRRTGITLSYAIPNSTIQGLHQSFTNGADVEKFFSGTGTVALGAKYAVGLSLIDIVIPVYTSPHIRFSIDWNLIDAEYYNFDWADERVADVTSLVAVKAGTRIGPSLSFLITKKINAAIYYSARPGIQFAVVNDLAYTMSANGGEATDKYLKTSLSNYNLTNEVGAKIRFGKFMLNPFYHFGTFAWKTEVYDGKSDNKISDIKTGYNFSYMGIRIGI